MVNMYYLCLEQDESVDHMLIHCDQTWILWNLVLCLFRVDRVREGLVKEVVASWN